MKKLKSSLALLMVLVMLVSLTACGKSVSTTNADANNNPSSSQPVSPGPSEPKTPETPAPAADTSGSNTPETGTVDTQTPEAKAPEPAPAPGTPSGSSGNKVTATTPPATKPTGTGAPAGAASAPAPTPTPTSTPTPAPASVPASGTYVPGTYTGSAKGFGGNVTVTVTVDSSKITALEAAGPSETKGVGSKALEQLPAKIKAANSTAVDAVSGATVTSTALLNATADALAQAKGQKKAAAVIAFKPGTYTGTAKGYNGDVTLNVTFSDQAITDIKVAKSAETDHVGTSAYDIMIASIKEYTSTGVDVVSGATFTSNAMLAAVENAAVQAGCDLKALQAGAKKFQLTPKAKITDTYDVVVVGAGGAGMAAAAAAAQKGSSVLVMEKMAEMGGNTLVAGGSFQAVQPALVWDSSDPYATTSVYEPTGEAVTKVKGDLGRLNVLLNILNWKETPFDGAVKDPAAIKTVEDYDLPGRGVHAEYLPTLLKLKDQIRSYLAYVDSETAKGKSPADLTLFDTVELHIFQTYYGGIRLSADRSQWIYGDFDLVNQICSNAYGTKAWYIGLGAKFNNTTLSTLIGCLWQRINGVVGTTIDGVEYSRNWGVYFKAPENAVLTAGAKNKIMTRTTATQLITNGAGQVVGVKGVQYDGTQVEITAKQGVILATGGYGANIDMVLDTNQYWKTTDLTAAVKTTNRSLAQGEGITMAQAVGAGVEGMGFTQLMPIGWADNGNLAGGNGEDVIFISPAGTPNAGKRYVDESAERDVLAQGAYDFGGKNGLFIQLTNGGTKTSANNVEGREYFCSLSEAANLLGIDEAVLKKTVTDYDAFIIGTSSEQSHPAKGAVRNPIGTCEKDTNGKYKPETYKIGTLSVRYLAPSTHHTMGGLTIDTDRHVLDTKGKVIPGLYAAGEVTGGIFAGNRLGGNAIMEIITSGKIAGENASAGK